MSIDISLSVSCTKCGDLLSACLSLRNEEVTVDPCSKCLAEDNGKGYEEGYEEGYDRGHADGYDKGYEECSDEASV